MIIKENRETLKNLSLWFNKKRKLPLILQGTRQVGKTSTVRKFAELNDIVLNEINFESSSQLKELFELDFDCERILKELSFFLKRDIAQESILFFDEIQECPRAINSLKYCECSLQWREGMVQFHSKDGSRGAPLHDGSIPLARNIIIL